jgi:hypothetical protein
MSIADNKDSGWIQDDDWQPTAEDLHRVYTCEGCGQYNSPRLMIERPCPTGDCTQVVCPRCGHEWASYGPILCKSCGDMNWFWRQHHRIAMFVFDRIELPIRRRWRKWRKR